MGGVSKKMKIKPIVFSFAVSIILSFVFLMAIFWIVYVYSGDLTATKDALNTTGNYFGGITALATTLVAAYLFNDWKQEGRFDLLDKYTSRLSDNVKKLKDLNYNFHEYQMGKNGDISMKTTHFHYLNYIWCFQEVMETLNQYFTFLEKTGSITNKAVLTKARDLHKSMLSNFEKTRMYESEMSDVYAVWATIFKNIGLICELETFVKQEAFEEVLNQIT